MKQFKTFIYSLSLFFSAQAQIFEIPENGDIVGEIFSISAQPGDTLQQIGQDFGIGYHEMRLANPNLNNYIAKHVDVVIPNQYILPPPQLREGVVINTAEPRLYYFTPDGEYVFTAAVAVGRSGWRTPLLNTYITNKTTRPTWIPPKSIRAHHYNKTGEQLPYKVGPGPDNPLGNYAIYVKKPRILIHGTNNENSIGKYASSGCIRLFNDDIQTLFRLVSHGEPVTIIHHSVKVGQLNNTWFIEKHRTIPYSNRASYQDALGSLIIENATDAFNYTDAYMPFGMSHGIENSIPTDGMPMPMH